MEAKPYALAAGVRAIDAQLQRLNLPGKAMQVEGFAAFLEKALLLWFCIL